MTQGQTSRMWVQWSEIQSAEGDLKRRTYFGFDHLVICILFSFWTAVWILLTKRLRGNRLGCSKLYFGVVLNLPQSFIESFSLVRLGILLFVREVWKNVFGAKKCSFMGAKEENWKLDVGWLHCTIGYFIDSCRPMWIALHLGKNQIARFPISSHVGRITKL